MVGRSYYVAIPPSIRKAMGLFPGDRIAWRLVGQHLVGERIPVEDYCKVKDIGVKEKPAESRR